jgi:hypothetical protein
MGLFDGKGLSPTPTTVLGMAQGAARGLGKALLDPMMESQGYLSEEKQVMNIMKGVDMSDPQSFTDAFNAIMAVSPEAAKEFKVQGMPILEANLASRKIGQTDRQLGQADEKLRLTEEELALEKKKLESTSSGDNQSKNWSIQQVGNPADPTQTITVRVNKVTGDSHPILDGTGTKYIKEIFAKQNSSTADQNKFKNTLDSYKAIERDYGTTFCKFSSDGTLQYSSCKPNKNTSFKDELPTLEEYFRSKSTGGNIYDTIQQTIVNETSTSDNKTVERPAGAIEGNHKLPNGTVIKVWQYPNGSYYSDDGALIHKAK